MFSQWQWKLAQTAELIWWKSYLCKRSTEDYLLWKKKYWIDLLEKIGLSDIDRPTTNILDLGCGPAGIFMVFDRADTHAVDPLLDKYETNLPHFKKSLYPKLNFYPISIENFIPVKPFDYVFCLNAINHVADLELSFDKLIQSLAQRGTVVVSIDAHNSQILKQIFRFLPGDILHPHQYDLKEYSEMLTQRNCTISKTILFKKESIFNYYILVATKNP